MLFVHYDKYNTILDVVRLYVANVASTDALINMARVITVIALEKGYDKYLNHMDLISKEDKITAPSRNAKEPPKQRELSTQRK